MYIVMIWWLQNRKRIEAADWGVPRGASLATVSASRCRRLRSEPSANWCRAKRLWAKWENYTFRGGISCSCWGAAAITSAWRRGRLALYVWRPRKTWRYVYCSEHGTERRFWYFHVSFHFSLSSYMFLWSQYLFPSSNFHVRQKTVIDLTDSDLERKEFFHFFGIVSCLNWLLSIPLQLMLFPH